MDKQKLQILSTSPPILERIYKFLNARDLSSCAKVCSLWSTLANTEKKRRNRLICISYPQILSNPPFAPDFEGDVLESELSNQLRNLSMQPYFFLGFGTRTLMTTFFEAIMEDSLRKKRQRSGDRVKLKCVLNDFLKKFLPTTCSTALVATPGVIATNFEEMPIEIEGGIGLSAFLFPKVPGVEVQYFSIDKKELNGVQFLPQNVKCLLVFSTSNTQPRHFIKKIIQDTDRDVALGGAIVDQVETNSTTTISFSGDNVEAATIVISHDEKEPEIIQKLKMFQKSGLLENKCFAFMFSCIGRGYSFHDKVNCESNIFSKMFPGVPLIGLFGNGEIGTTFVPGITPFNRTKSFLHAYSTIFVLVSIKM